METTSKQIAHKRVLTELEKSLSHTFKKNPMARVKVKARESNDCVFTSLAHLITPELLRDSFNELRNNAAVGLDGVSYADYENHLQERIKNEIYISLSKKDITLKTDIEKVQSLALGLSRQLNNMPLT